MKKHLLKSLLVGVMTLAATSAWAGDKTVVKYSFDDANSPALTAGSRVTLDYSHTSVITNTAFLNMTNNANGAAGSSTISLGSEDLTEEAWTLTFEWAANGGCNSKTGHTILKAGDTNLFDIVDVSNWNTANQLTYGETSVDLSVPACNKSNRFGITTADLYNTTTYWHHFVITGSKENGVKLTVTNSSTGTVIVDNVTLSAENVTPTSMVVNPSCGGAVGLDELSLSYYVEGEVIQTPLAAYTKVDGISRTITATCDTEGATLYYSTDGENWTEGAEVTVSESGKIYFKAVKGTSESDVLEFDAVAGEAIVLNAPVINRTSNTSVTISADQTNLLLSPDATIYYTYGEESGSFTGSMTLTVAADATISAYAVAEGYTNSETSERAVALFPIYVEQIENTAAKTSDWSANAFSEEVISISERTYAALMLDGEQWGQNIYLQTDGAWGLRATGNWYINSDTQESWLLMQNMKKGDIIVVNVTYPASSTVNATYSKYSFGTMQAYEVAEDGNVELAFKKINASTMDYIYGVYAYREVATKTIGLVPGVWAADDATFAAYAWNAEGNAWFPFVEVSGAYATQIPENYTGINIVRLKPATAEGYNTDNYGLNWDNKWNQTADIDFTTVADKTVFTITGWGEGEGANSTYTTGTVPTDLTELKAALEDAITEATALNAYANDETLTNAIIAAQAALANEESTAEDLALVATALKIAATNAAKDVLQKAVTLAGTFGIDASAAQAVLDKEDATIEELKTALTTFLETAIPAAKEALAQAKSFFNTFDKTAAEELKGDFDAAEAALAGTDINAMITAAQTLMYDAMPAAQKALEKVFKYVELIDDATLSADAAAIQTAMADSNLKGMIDAANKMKEDFPTAVQGYVKKVEDLATAGETNGKKGVDELKAAINTAKSAIVTATINKDIVAMGEAIRNLVLAVEAYKQANIFYTVAGTKDLTGTENDFDVVEANNMTIDPENGLYTWTAENITVTADVNPAFKVVKTDLEGQTWYPEGDESTNWVINPAVTGEEGVFTIIITFNAETNYIGVDTKKAGAPENIAIYPTGGDIAAALEEAKAKVAKVGDITINLAVDGVYTLGATLTAPNSIFVYGNEATVTVDEEMTGDFITLDGTETFAMKSETEASDHKLIQSVEIRGLNLKGLKGALVKDAQKTLVEDLAIDWSNIEMPAAGKNVLDFNGKGYTGKVTVTNSTIWANGMNTGFFAQYGSRPKNINGDWLQEFDIENSTIVNIANGKNVCDVKQNGTAQNVYTLKNNIFVDCGKQNQVVVGFNKGQTSATPVWDVEGNYFAWGGACVNAAETEKTGQKDEEDIVKNSVDGTLIFTDAANGDFNGEFELAEGAEAPAALGAPYWTITFKAAPAAPAYYLVGNMTNWVEDGLKEEYKLTKNDKAEEGVEEYMITLNLTTESQFKIAKQDGELFVYYPDGTGNAYGENGEIVADGEYTVYFRPNADGGEDWFYKVIYVASTTTGISYVTIDTENAVIYNLSGQRVTKAQKGLFIVNGKKVVLK